MKIVTTKNGKMIEKEKHMARWQRKKGQEFPIRRSTTRSHRAITPSVINFDSYFIVYVKFTSILKEKLPLKLNMLDIRFQGTESPSPPCEEFCLTRISSTSFFFGHLRRI